MDLVQFIQILFYRTDTVQLLLESHPELVGPFTAYGGAMYCHTPLHLASRNGHRYVKTILKSMKESRCKKYVVFVFPAKISGAGCTQLLISRLYFL